MEIGSFLTLHMFVMLVGVVLTANCLTLVLFFSIRMMQGKDENRLPFHVYVGFLFPLLWVIVALMGVERP